jgi:hypothetical protein
VPACGEPEEERPCRVAAKRSPPPRPARRPWTQASGQRRWASGRRAQSAAAPDSAPRRRRIRAPDGVEIAAYEHGNPQGPAILFVHGHMQAALSWDRQTRDPGLARELRVVATTSAATA